jgi:hypothetical protein
MRNLYTRTLILTLLALCAAARGASGQQAAPKLNWQEFKSEAGGFSMKFPGAPQLSKLPMSKGPLTLTRNVHTATSGIYEFHMEYVDMPAGYDEPELALEGGISGVTHMIEADGGRVLTKEKIVRGTCEGLEATFAAVFPAGVKGFAQTRIFSSGQRYYFAIFSARGGGEGAREVARTFMDSLVIKDGCKAPLIPTPAPTAEPIRSTIEGTRDPATGWRKIESPEYGFSVLMPGPAERTSTQAQTQPFVLFHHEFIYETDDIIYSAEMFGDYPAGFNSTAASRETLLDVTLAAIKRNLGALDFTYSEPRKLNVGIYPGREYILTSEKIDVRGRVQLYSTPRRAYIFLAISRGQTPRDREIERFFSSVRVSPK